MSTPMPDVPNDFSAPGDMSPADLAEYLRRLRANAAAAAAGANPVGNENVMGTAAQPAVTTSDPNDPMAVSRMLGFAKAAAPSINGSYTANVLAKLGRNTGPAQPTNPSEYDKLYDPNTYDLPQDLARRQAAMGTFDASSKLATAEAERGKTGAEAVREGAKAREADANAGLLKSETGTGDGRPSTAKDVEALSKAGKDSTDPAFKKRVDARIAELTGMKPAPPEGPSIWSRIASAFHGASASPSPDAAGALAGGGPQAQPGQGQPQAGAPVAPVTPNPKQVAWGGNGIGIYTDPSGVRSMWRRVPGGMIKITQ